MSRSPQTALGQQWAISRWEDPPRSHEVPSLPDLTGSGGQALTCARNICLPLPAPWGYRLFGL